MTAWHSGIVDVAAGRLAYHRTGGSGPPLVLSHGLTDNGLCWRRLAEALEADFDIIMLDARGHGASSGIAEDPRRDLAEDIAEAIDGLGLTAPVVMGHSVGGRASAAFAGAYPGRVSKVILEDPPFTAPADPAAAERRRERFRTQVETLRAMTHAEIVAMGRSMSPSWHEDEFPDWAQAKALVDPDAMPSYVTQWQEEIAGITAPTLIIHGDPKLGSLVTPEIAAEARAINPRTTAVQIPGAGHNVRRENFAGVLTAVRDFLFTG